MRRIIESDRSARVIAYAVFLTVYAGMFAIMLAPHGYFLGP